MKEHLIDTMTVSEALIWAYEALSKNGVAEARAESEFLLTHVLACKRHELFLNARRPLSSTESSTLSDWIERRIKREPSQYIIGSAEFRSLSLKVTRDVLIPRPETELLVDEAIKASEAFKGEDLTIIDLCTGSGCIAISAATEIKRCRVYATDISGKALAVAAENAVKAGVKGKIDFLEGDLFGALPPDIRGSVNMVLSNPPYIPEVDMETLEPEVRDFEPKAALRGGPDGLLFIKRIIEGSPEYLATDGLLLMEIGFGQAREAVRLAMESGSFVDIGMIKDYQGIERILKARAGGA